MWHISKIPSVVCYILLPVPAAVTKLFSVRQHWFGIPECRPTDFFCEREMPSQPFFRGEIHVKTKKLLQLALKDFSPSSSFWSKYYKLQQNMTYKWQPHLPRKRGNEIFHKWKSQIPLPRSRAQQEFNHAQNCNNKSAAQLVLSFAQQMTDVNWQLGSDRSNPTYCHAQVCLASHASAQAQGTGQTSHRLSKKTFLSQIFAHQKVHVYIFY